jgi:hypothetical protein
MGKMHIVLNIIVRLVQPLYPYTFKGLVMSAVGLSIVFFVVQAVVLPSVNE